MQTTLRFEILECYVLDVTFLGNVTKNTVKNNGNVTEGSPVVIGLC